VKVMKESNSKVRFSFTAMGFLLAATFVIGLACSPKTIPTAPSNSGLPGTTLSAGDVAFVAYTDQGSPNDQYAFVLMKSVAAGTQINITDRGWDNTIGGFWSTSSETINTWTAPVGGCAEGTQIQIDENGIPNVGSMAVTGTNAIGLSKLSNGGDQLLVFQGSSVSPTFLTALTFGSSSGSITPNGSSFQTSGAATSNSTYLPPGLTAGVNAMALNVSYESGIYNCALTSGSKSQLDAALNNPANWIADANGTAPAVLGTVGCAFSIGGAPPTATFTSTATDTVSPVPSATWTNTPTVTPTSTTRSPPPSRLHPCSPLRRRIRRRSRRPLR
jgi:hypothetical protein